MLVRPGKGDPSAQRYRYRFERGKRRGELYDFSLAVCHSPLCHCSDLYLRCAPRDSPAGDVPVELSVTLDVLRRKWVKHRSGDRASRALGRDLARDLDAEDWAVLRRHFFGVKLDLTRDADLASLEDVDFPHEDIEGESLLIAYQQIVPFDQILQIEAGGELLQIDDLYCVRPDCPCRDVHLVFLPIPPEAPAGWVRVEDPAETCITLNLGSRRWRVEEQGKLAVDAATIMKALFEQLRPRSMLPERRRVLRALYRNYLRRIGLIPPPSAVRAKTGRNHPCPCGSGKKFKKCCLPKGLGR